MNKSLSFVNLSSELHVVSTFWLEYDTSGTFSLSFAQPSLNLRDQHWRCTYFGAELTFVTLYVKLLLTVFFMYTNYGVVLSNCNYKLSAKVSLLLENQFPVPSLCKLNHTSICFIQISTNIPANSWFPSEKAMFFKVIPSVLFRSVNFNIT